MPNEVCVVGAGPGGLFVAKSLSEKGIRPLILEKNTNLSEVVCGELIGRYALEMLGVSKSSEMVDNEFQRTEIVSLDSNVKMEIGKKIIGEHYLLKSDLMKELLKESAESNGAAFKPNTEVIDVIRSNGSIVGVKTRQNSCKCNITVGADGSNSTIARKSGLYVSGFKTVPSMRIKLKNCKDLDPKCAYFYLSRDIGLGYLWLYPRGETEANVGIGSITSRNMIAVLNNFIKKRAELKTAKVVMRGAGTVPYSGLLPRFTGDGVLLVGDSAGQVSNLVGGGMATTFRAAEISVETIIHAIESCEYSEEILGTYEKGYRDSPYGLCVQNTARYLSTIIDFSEKEDLFAFLDKVLEYMRPDMLYKVVKGEQFANVMLLRMLLGRPRVLLLILKMIKSHDF